MVSFLTQTTDRPSQGAKLKIKLIFETNFPERKAETMTSVTLAHFVKTAQAPEEPKSLLNLIPFVVYNKFIADNLSEVDKLCVELATSREQRPLTDKELDDALKSDADKAEDAEWDDYTLDEYDDYYDTDFSAQWAEPVSDGEDYTIDNERDNW